MRQRKTPSKVMIALINENFKTIDISDSVRKRIEDLNSLDMEIYEYVKKEGINSSYKHWCDDLCIGLWVQEIAKTTEVSQIHNENFHIKMNKNADIFKTALTFHELRELSDYEYYMGIKIDNGYFIRRGTVFALITDKKYFEKMGVGTSIVDLVCFPTPISKPFTYFKTQSFTGLTSGYCSRYCFNWDELICVKYGLLGYFRKIGEFQPSLIT